MVEGAPKNDERPRSLKAEAFKWFGIVGTAFTIFSNAGAFIEFSRFVKSWTDQWRELITAFINFIVQIVNVTLDESIAVIVFAVVSCLVVALSAQGRLTEPWSPRFRIVSLIVAATLSSIYFCFVMLGPTATDPRMEEQILMYAAISFGISFLLASLVFARSSPIRDRRLNIAGIAVFVLVLIPGSLTEFGTATFIRDAVDSKLPEMFFFGLLSTLVVTMHFVSQPITIAFRSLGIVIILAALIALNLIATWFDDLGWLA